jgi:hypothetical protein
VPVILVDANIEGHAARLWSQMRSSRWREFTDELDVTFRTFRDAGLDPASTDSAVWHFCQAQGYYLLTGNRNEESEDSLEATIRREGTASSLPVFTLALPDRVFHSPGFPDRVVEKLLEYLLDADNIRGTGRLYLP